MIIQNRELEALQQKIREAEDRLKARETLTSAETDNSKHDTGKREEDYRSTGESSLRSIWKSAKGR